MSTSKLIKADSLTEKSNAADGFKPATETEKYSYTSARVAAPVYNKYRKANKPKVFGYYTDWSQYDGRLQGQDSPESRGRGYDLAHVDPTAYDKIIFGFIGIVGDQGEKQFTINNAATQTGKVTGEPTFLDPWGDFQSYVNCNQETSGWDVDPKTVTESTTHGLLGGLRDLQAKAKSMDHELALSMSIGGWTMSNGFHEMAKTEATRKVFAAGVVKLFKQFPMFSEVDIDWEYPNNAGNGNPHGVEDGENYALLIKELKTQLNAAGRGDVKVSIASSAVVEVLGYSNVKALLDAGLYAINVMTYDFFGTPWAAELTHHTNLTPLAEGSWSVEAVVDYLIAEGFPSDRINIGYAGYTRNARNAEVESVSPLKGSYNPGQGTTTGSFESGCTEWYDTIYNYLDLENQSGRNGFNVYTDTVADADFLYNPQSKLFMSLDTPRSVKAKGEYAAKHNLGGLFTWTIDQDNGVLLNAAREGLGYEVQTQVVDMAPFYFSGMTAIDGVVPDDETSVDPQPEPTPDDTDVEPQPEPTPDEGETSGDTWDATATYMENDLVIWKGHQYKAGWWTVGDQPDLNCGVGQPWNDLGAI
ncbi:glycosyl hydrolase family 18 protein [Yokenella regensburgei]|jgi:GH18 family chitinase|uniref:chitinase n=1 Tax=Yokenella regensburgei TaxID=158877 RepID=A0AB38FWM8_9ENTR|nr:glycosyl hydrolase family 18 protein [Yokenella regensburgei]KFD25448.1 chitinase [Yokenella regensburgei ATCC 49455]MDR2217553.1 chitinase [Yokenella regensburgei]SQA63166.1 Chitinase A1 precursor [Yokenella regensburgei]SQA68586.1 Chitinase A1 precursor [Yokenella regensburgei]SUQ06901.1 Chitinase A1 precursor [Yokenella regensburgei]